MYYIPPNAEELLSALIEAGERMVESFPPVDAFPGEKRGDMRAYEEGTAGILDPLYDMFGVFLASWVQQQPDAVQYAIIREEVTRNPGRKSEWTDRVPRGLRYRDGKSGQMAEVDLPVEICSFIYFLDYMDRRFRRSACGGRFEHYLSHLVNLRHRIAKGGERPARPGMPESPYRFAQRPDGSWDIAFEGKSVKIDKPTKGLKYIEAIIWARGKVSVVNLSKDIEPDPVVGLDDSERFTLKGPGGVRRATTARQLSSRDAFFSGDLRPGKSDFAFKGRSREELMGALRLVHERQKECVDPEELDDLRDKERRLARAISFKGRTVPFVEKQRTRIFDLIKTARSHIYKSGGAGRELARYLEEHLHTGNYCWVDDDLIQKFFN